MSLISRRTEGEAQLALLDDLHFDLRRAVDRQADRDVPERTTRARYQALARRIVVSDALCIVMAFGISYLLGNSVSPNPSDRIIVTFLAPFVWLPIFHAHGLYAPQHLSAVEEFRRVISACSVGIVVVVIASFWSGASFSRLCIGSVWPLALVLEGGSRIAWRRHIDRLRREGRLSFRTAIVGTNGEADRLARVLGEPGSGLEVIGSISVSDVYISRANGLGILGRLSNLPRIVRERAVECLYVASSDITPEEMAEVTQMARRAGVDVKLSSSLSEIIASRVTMQPIKGCMAISLKEVRLDGLQTKIKRAFDLLVASIGWVVALPVAALAAVALRLESRGPVLFKQNRVTRGGRVFQMYKFRTMVANEGIGSGIDTSAPFFKLQADPRVTRIGRILRRTSIDELPQLINVIRGDMSLVGPRPLPADQVAANLDLLDARHEVLAGVTGWWQISGRSDVGPEEAVRLDIFYIENWSLSLDMYVLLKTLGVLVTRKGAV